MLKPARHYFVLQTNPGEQFFMFSSLAAWLIRKSGRQFDPPQEFDDPNSVIANILDHVRRLAVTIDFAPSKLKAGYGEQALFVLDTLCDEALKAVRFEWRAPLPPRELQEEEEEMEEDEAEVDIERVEEDMAGDYSEEEEEDILHINDVMGGRKEGETGVEGEAERPHTILASHTNSELWSLEVERVAPLLKVPPPLLLIRYVILSSPPADDCED